MKNKFNLDSLNKNIDLKSFAIGYLLMSIVFSIFTAIFSLGKK